MRKVFLCTLMIFGFMNFCIGQLSTKSERIHVKTYDIEGTSEQFQLKGSEALSFDVPEFIMENDHLERIVINGMIMTNLSATIIKFDSSLEENQDGDYLCKDVQSKLTPFLGVYGTGRSDLTGVDVRSIVPATSAEKAGIISGEIITEFNGAAIYDFADLKKAVLFSEIGDRVELKIRKDSDQYSKQVIVGSRKMETVTYKYCQEEPMAIVNNLNVNNEDATFSAYPNPTSSLSHVTFKYGSDKDVTFIVTDVTGALVHKEVISNFNGTLRFDHEFENERVGTYIFSIQQGKEIYNQKVQLIKD